MSSPWFPDNINRGDRAKQLATDISNIQNEVVQSQEQIKDGDTRLQPYIDKLLKRHNMASFEQLQQKVADSLSDKDRVAYESMFQSQNSTGQGMDTAIKIISGMTLGSVVLRRSIKIGNAIRALGIVNLVKGWSTVFYTFVTKGFKAGMASYRAMRSSLRGATKGLKMSSKAARFASIASRWLKVIGRIGFAVDVLLIGIDIGVASKQRSDLQQAIKDLLVSRASARLYANMAGAIKTWNGTLLVYAEVAITPQMEQAADMCANMFINNVSLSWEKITPENVLKELMILDGRRSSWTAEDTKYQDLLTELQESKDDLDKEVAGKTGKNTAIGAQPAGVAFSVSGAVADSLDMDDDDAMDGDYDEDDENDAYDIDLGDVKAHHPSSATLEKIIVSAQLNLYHMPVDTVFQGIIYCDDLNKALLQQIAEAD